ncbi:hypothetical protein EYF80_042917 [Liparis tanakae]|uniref:Uncharacterized protein n=1 Tax=Liparis tanakae TaxID=230148 RepID=A0A4Z2G0S4_9TELE|nr:hypothetical protein EYF80_042917 [Liparis tanakae]
MRRLLVKQQVHAAGEESFGLLDTWTAADEDPVSQLREQWRHTAVSQLTAVGELGANNGLHASLHTCDTDTATSERKEFGRFSSQRTRLQTCVLWSLVLGVWSWESRLRRTVFLRWDQQLT